MKQLSLVMLFFFNFFVTLAQNTLLYKDFLLNALAVVGDNKNKVELLNLISYVFWDEYNIQEGLKYTAEAIMLAENLHLKKELAEAYSYQAVFYDLKSDSVKALEYLEKSSYLFKQIADPGDKSRILVNYCNLYKKFKNYPKTFFYAIQLLAIRIEQGDKNKISAVLKLLGDVSINQNNHSDALRYYLRSFDLDQESKEPLKAGLADNIGQLYAELRDYTNADKFYNIAIQLSEQPHGKPQLVAIYNHLGNLYIQQGKFSQALDSYTGALNINKALKDKSQIAVSLNKIASIHTNSGNFSVALEYALESLKMSEGINDSRLTAANYHILSAVYTSMRDTSRALHYLTEAKKIYEKTGDNEIVAMIENNIGALYTLINKDSSIKFIARSLNVSDESVSKWNIPNNLVTISDIHKAEKEYDQAIRDLLRALQLNEQKKDSISISINCAHLGVAYLEMTEDSIRNYLTDSPLLPKTLLLKKSKTYLLKSILICEKVKSFNLLNECYRLLSKVEEAQQNYPAALQSYKKHILYRDSVFSPEKSSAITSNTLQYEFDKKQAKKDKANALERAHTKANQQLWLLSGTSFFIISILIFYFSSKIKSNRFKIQLTALRQEALNAQMSDHFIGNTMDSINGFIKNNDKEKAGEYLQKFSRLIRKVLENAGEKLVSLNDDLNILKDYLDLEKLRFTEGFDYKVSVEEKIDVYNVLVPPMIFQTLAENSIKHGFRKAIAGNLLLLTISQKNKMLECIVEDNGLGRTQSFINNERNSRGQGIAQELIKAVSKSGTQTSFKITDIVDENNNPAGTKVEFLLPYISEA